MKSVLYLLWKTILSINWEKLLMGLVDLLKRKDKKVEDKYIAIQEATFSDENLIEVVKAIRFVFNLVPVPASTIASSLFGLGITGFNIWKHIVVSKDFKVLEFPVANPSILRITFKLDKELNLHYEHKLTSEAWNEGVFRELEVVYNDLKYITNSEILKRKYPHMSPLYLETRALENERDMQTSIEIIQQTLIEKSSSAQMNHEIKEAFVCIKELFPAINNYAVVNSAGFNVIIDLIDTLV